MSVIGKGYSKKMDFEGQQGKSLKYFSEICNLPSFSSLEAEGKVFSGHGISHVAENTAGNQGQL